MEHLRGRGFGGDVVAGEVVGHDGLLLSPRGSARGLYGPLSAGSDARPAPSLGRSEAEDAGAENFLFREEWRSPWARHFDLSPPGEEILGSRVAGRAAHPAPSPKLEPRACAHWTVAAGIDTTTRRLLPSPAALAHEALSIVDGELTGDACHQDAGSIGDEIVVEVLAPRRKGCGFDRHGVEARRETSRCVPAGSVAVDRDVEAA